jgi:hypothetical protein
LFSSNHQHLSTSLKDGISKETFFQGSFSMT